MFFYVLPSIMSLCECFIYEQRYFQNMLSIQIQSLRKKLSLPSHHAYHINDTKETAVVGSNIVK
jgi:hypothetical protein